MTVEELGAETRKLTDAVLARDYMAMLSQIGAGYKAFEEFIAGFRHQMQGVGSGQPALPVALATVDLGPLELADGELLEACRESRTQLQTQPQPMQADPVGFGPAEILLLIQAAQAFAELVRKWRERRQRG